MKTLKRFEFRLFTLIILSAAVFYSCENQSPKPGDDSVAEAKKENDIKFENNKLEKDAQFLVDATAFNLEIVRLGELAKQKGSAELKRLDGDLAEKHNKALKEVRDLAEKKQVSVPDSASNESYELLQAKSGDEFEKSYYDRLVELHEKAVKSYEKEVEDTRDQDIKEWAATNLTTLREHLDMIFESQKKLENK